MRLYAVYARDAEDEDASLEIVRDEMDLGDASELKRQLERKGKVAVILYSLKEGTRQ